MKSKQPTQDSGQRARITNIHGRLAKADPMQHRSDKRLQQRDERYDQGDTTIEARDDVTLCYYRISLDSPWYVFALGRPPRFWEGISISKKLIDERHYGVALHSGLIDILLISDQAEHFFPMIDELPEGFV